MNLTPWDVQSKQIHTTDGVVPPLYSGECRYGGGEAYILATERKHNEEDTDNTERPRGGVMDWNYKELAATLRAQMSSSHPPLVVLLQKNQQKQEESDSELNAPQP